MASLSRQLAQWVVGLRYDDLPPAVIDRAKGVTLQGLASVLLGSLTPGGRQAVQLMSEEEAGVKNGKTLQQLQAERPFDQWRSSVPEWSSSDKSLDGWVRDFYQEIAPEPAQPPPKAAN